MQKKIEFSTFWIQRKDPDLLKQYDAVFLEHLSTGIIEIVPESEYQDKNVHFIAHQPNL